MSEHKLDIFRVLKAADKKDHSFLSELTNDELKSLQPMLIARWLSGVSNKQQIFIINEIVNPYIFNLYNHKELLWSLLTICTTGKYQKYNWIKSNNKRKTITLAIKALKQYFHYSTRHAEQAFNLLQPNDIALIAEELGWQLEDLNKLRKELNLPTIKKISTTKEKEYLDF
ncbi:MAG: hypothetical protein ACXW2E_00315 [Nitrososphaeraceae archaeon]